MNVRKYSSWNRDKVKRSLNVSLNLTPLTTETGLCPEVDISGKELPDKTPGNQSPGSSFTRMRNLADRIKNFFLIGSGTRGRRTPVEYTSEKFGPGNGNRDNLQGGGLAEVLNLRTGLLEQGHLRILNSCN